MLVLQLTITSKKININEKTSVEDFPISLLMHYMLEDFRRSFLNHKTK